MRFEHVEIQRSRRFDYIRKFDYVLMIAVLAISAIGLVFLNSAQYDKYLDHGSKAMTVQVVGLLLGIISALVISFFDYDSFKKICIPFYAVNLLLMLVVFLPGIGTESGGSRSWLNLGFTTYQPSELMKLAMIVFLAYYIEKANNEGMTLKNSLIILGGFAIPLGIVFMQKDLGMALVYVVIFLTMLFVGKIKVRYILGFVCMGLLAVPFVWKFYLNGVRRYRFMGFLDPENELYFDYTLQLRRSLDAISSGGLFGQGVGEGEMNTSNRIIVKLTDMIFTVICEEAGFIGAALVIAIFAFMLLRMVRISSKSRDLFGRCIVAGILAMFAFTIFENIGMNIGIMPITGLPLPFVSQGGSAMLTNYVAIGFVLSVSMRRESGLFDT
ncbi:MAG: rod shape-determining protein RodA [Ruminococcaceae bacterium]|nr:rod shape-determining protein RodA [Oscillospiraceae bacterium]